ncbi:siderophore-interacting protein [Flavobacterium aquicola]|uniref:Siderophore-interacting protein n=1 Tax=Flavobacterium aquicola TaxID=1682742 RepID=A0A3E0EV40_9FLAO|nr:siderophore-interacting protein [Flavobacterium aquicola]REH00977.1 siderophore-interacting protein [Flavobacterium aquicola]
MPSVPKFIGDFMELAFIEKTFSSKICKATVVSTKMTSRSIKTIMFKSVFPQVNFKIGQAIIIRIDDTKYRNYTPSKWNSELGTFEVVFHIHNNGPGSKFIENLKPNDQLTVGLPRGFNIYNQKAKYHFFFGDETCLSVFKSLKDEINKDDNNYLGILELDETAMKVPNEIGVVVDIVAKSPNKAEFAIEALHKMETKCWDLWKDGYFYLMGNAKSIQNFRKALKEKGIQSRNIYTKPYWADGKIGI